MDTSSSSDNTLVSKEYEANMELLKVKLAALESTLDSMVTMQQAQEKENKELVSKIETLIQSNIDLASLSEKEESTVSSPEGDGVDENNTVDSKEEEQEVVNNDKKKRKKSKKTSENNTEDQDLYNKHPTAIIIGSQKGGTDSLRKKLNQHPLLLGSIKTEVHFFDRMVNFARFDKELNMTIVKNVPFARERYVEKHWNMEVLRDNPNICSFEKTPSYLTISHAPRYAQR